MFEGSVEKETVIEMQIYSQKDLWEWSHCCKQKKNEIAVKRIPLGSNVNLRNAQQHDCEITVILYWKERVNALLGKTLVQGW